MDYQFTRDHNAKAMAEFSMGSEAMGHWFNEELGDNLVQIAQLLNVIEKLQKKNLNQFHVPGREFHLTLNTDEVEVVSKLLAHEELDELPEGTELYDQESVAGCGLEDFKHILESWQQFVSE